MSGGSPAAGLGDRRFRLRSDVTVLLNEEGAVVRGPATSLELKSRSIGEAISWLWPRLDGTRPLEAVTAELPPGTRGAMAGLVARLHSGGMLLDLVEEDPERLARLSGLYPEQVSFLAHRSGTPLAAFDRFRRANIRVQGEGVVLRNVAAALADYGALKARFATPAPDPALDRLVAAANGRDPERDFEIGDGGGEAGGEGNADILIDAGCDLADAFAARLCDPGASAPRLAGIYRSGERLAVLLHLGRDGEAPCFRSFADAAPKPPDPEPIAPAAAAIAAHHCVAALFSDLTGIVAQGAPSLLEIDQDRLTSRARRLAGHPDCPRHGAQASRTALPAEAVLQPEASFPRPDIPDSVAATRETYDAIHRASSALVAPVGGPFLDLGEADLAQVPFARSAVSVRLSSRAGGSDERLVCAALSAREARNQVMLLAAERWSGSACPTGEPGEAGVGAGWSLTEAAVRALAGLAGEAGPDGDIRRLSLEEVARHGPTTAHLAEIAAGLGSPALEGEGFLLAKAAHGGWLSWRASEPSSSPALGATPGQALGNSLFRALVRCMPDGPHAGTLVCDAAADDVRAMLAEASRRVEFVEIDTPMPISDAADGVRLRLVEARRRRQ